MPGGVRRGRLRFDAGIAEPGFRCALVEELDEFGGARIVEERLVLLEDRRRERALRFGGLDHRPGRRIHVEVQRRRIVDLLHCVEQLVALEPDRADPDEIGLRVLDPRGDRAEVAIAEFPFEK